MAMRSSLFASASVLGRGLPGLSSLEACQLSWNFALQQFVLLMAAWFAGIKADATMAEWSHWVATLAIALVAFKMLWIRRTNRSHNDPSDVDDPTMVLAVATTVRIHPLVLGFVLALLSFRSVIAALVAGSFVAVITPLGIVSASKKGLQVARDIQAVGGCILILVVVAQNVFV